MGFFDSAKSALSGQRALKLHRAANELADNGKPGEAAEKYKEALRLYEESIQLGITAQNVLQGYVLLLLRDGQFEKARETMLKISKMKTLTQDDWFQLRLYFSIYQWRTGQLDKAIETIGRAAAHKMNGNIYSMLGMYMVDKAEQTGDFAEAMAFNEKALDYDDEDAACLDNMARLYQVMSEAEGDAEKKEEYRAKAIEYYRKAHKEKPRQITTLYYLAQMHHQAGDDERARKLLSVRDTLYIAATCPVSRQMMDDLAKEVG